MAVCICATVRS